MSYDERCDDLAEYFLCDVNPALNTTDNRAELAQLIQDAIEAWFERDTALIAEWDTALLARRKGK